MSEKTKAQVPPGFRFHPTDEELITHYLQKKVFFPDKFELEHVIQEVDLNKLEPWDLREKCKDVHCQSEWYFFSHKDKKYPTGTRTNRATKAGFWKATGRDKAVFSSKNTTSDASANGVQHIGMRKTLVFYKGRAPHGLKTDWIMHEYRLHDSSSNPNSKQPKEDGWVVCRVFKKRNYEERSYSCEEHVNLSDEEQIDGITKAKTKTRVGKEVKIHQRKFSNGSKPLEMNNQALLIPCKQEQVEADDVSPLKHSSFLQLPQLESHQPDMVINENDLTKTNSCEESKAPNDKTQKSQNATQNYHIEQQGIPSVKPFFMMEDDINNYMESSNGHISECWNLYENLVRLNGIETIANIFNDQHPLDFNRFQSQNDNHTSNCEIELWSFPK